MTDRFDVVAAFADGEPISGDELDAALADPAGRAYLIDILALRGLVNPQMVVAASPPSRSATAGRRWAPAIAALVVAGVAGGYFAGRETAPATRGEDVSPTVLVPASTSPAPAPTHVIRMENGVNWNEKAGGN